MKLKQKDFRFYCFSKMWKMNVKREDFRYYQCLKYVESERKAGRFQILPMFRKMCKMEVEWEDFRFYRC